MTEFAYSPMHAPRKEVSEETMKETLARRVRESVQKHAERVSAGAKTPDDSTGLAVGTATAVGKPSIAAVQWDKPVRTSEDGLGYQKSSDARFVIAKVRWMGAFRYTASRCQVGQVARVLGSFPTSAEAQACCERPV